MKPHVRFLINSFFIILFISLVYWFVNPLFVYHFQQIGFFNDIYFFKSMLTFPGGLFEYASIFLFQFAKYRFAGAVLYAILIYLILLLVKKLLASTKIKANILVMYLPVLVLSVLIGNYSFPVYYLLLAVVMIFLLIVYKAFSKLLKHYYEQFLPAIFIMPLAFYLLGGGVFLLFSVSLLFVEIFNSHRIKPISLLLITLLAVVVPLISAHYVFFITVNNAFTYFGPSLSSFPFSLELLLFFAAVPLALFLQWIAIKIGKFVRIKPLYTYLQYTIVAIVFILLFVLNFDHNQRFKTEIDYLAYNNKWEAIIEKVEANPSNERLVNFHTNMALYYTGKMPEKLFHYPQQWGADGLFLVRHFMNEILIPSTRLYYELGHINEAVHWANEAISQREHSPQIIEQLIVAHIVDGNFDAAKHYLNLLSKFMFYKPKAAEYQKMIDENSLSQSMLEVQKMIPVENFVVSRMSPNSDLYYLLVDHPNNRMAYEYLMSYYLLNNDLDSFARYFPLGFRFNYEHFPAVYQQALTYYMYKLNIEGKQVPNIKIDNEVLAEFSDYITTYSEFEQSLTHAKDLLKKYKDTYWYYLHFESPVTLNRKIVLE